MWRAPVYVRHTSLPDPKTSIFILCRKGFEMWFLIPNMQRPWRRKRRRRVEPSSSLHAALLSCTGTILVVVHLENHYFHHHHTPHRCLWWECWWWLSSPMVQSNHDFWSGYGGILIEMKSQRIGVWRWWWWVVGVEMMGVFSPQQSLDRVSFLCQGWSLVWGCLSPKHIIIVNVTLLILPSSYSSSSRRVNLNMSKPTTYRLFFSIMKIGGKLMNVQQMDLHEQW